MILPQEFKNRMKKLLGDEYAAFEASYANEIHKALRINALKAEGDILAHMPFSLTPVPWAENGYYYAACDAPGKHPYHDAGLYYIQEPSAMAPAEYLDAAPGDKILDLCAAPGGKSTQIAAKMKGMGILIANEIHPVRAKILSENIERMGVCNAIVTNEAPQRLAEFFRGYFDKILVDAPCSGEGMFRKHDAASGEWSIDNINLCARRQDEILACAADMLRPGGRLVYSTCTFAPEENEGSVSRMIRQFPEFEIVSVRKTDEMTDGIKGIIEQEAERIGHAVRLFPHRLRGEGHFLAVLQKRSGFSGSYGRCETETGIPEKSCAEWLRFSGENLKEIPKGIYCAYGDQLYLLPENAPLLRGLKAIRPGLHLGMNKKNRFEPSHALALYLKKEDACRCLDLPSEGMEITAYLSGQAIPSDGAKGWHLVTTDGYGIGWGKLSGGMMKNHYPKGLRKRLS